MFTQPTKHPQPPAGKSLRLCREKISHPQQSPPPPSFVLGPAGSIVLRGRPGAVLARRLGLSRTFWITSSNTCFTPTFVFALCTKHAGNTSGGGGGRKVEAGRGRREEGGRRGLWERGEGGGRGRKRRKEGRKGGGKRGAFRARYLPLPHVDKKTPKNKKSEMSRKWDCPPAPCHLICHSAEQS